MTDNLQPRLLGHPPETEADRIAFVAFDTETTGFGDAYLVEIGAVKFTAAGELEQFSQLIKPGVAIPYSATAVHGITNRMVSGRPGVERVLPEFFEFCAGAVPIAHNSPFDMRIIAAECLRHGLPRPDGAVLDSLRLARRLFPGFPNHQLGTVCELLGIDIGQAHRALADARAVAGILLASIEVASRQRRATLDDLLRLNGPPYDYSQAFLATRVKPVPRRPAIPETGAD